MKILICGDTHGRMPVLEYYQEESMNNLDLDCAIQVGDFGFYKGVFKAEWRMPLETYVIDGNHENHPWLLRNNREHSDQWLEDKNIRFQTRGTVASFGSGKIGFLGGAMNVDREQETTYCPNTSNYITREEAKKAIEVFNKEQPELIVTHSCPHSIGVGMRGHPAFEPLIETFVHKLGFTTGDISDCGEEALKIVWEGLNYKPKAWVYGHFHKYRSSTVDGVDFMCVGRTDTIGSKMIPIVWDTETKKLVYHTGIVI